MKCMTGVAVATARGAIAGIGVAGTAVAVVESAAAVGATSRAWTVDSGVTVGTEVCLSSQAPPTDDAKIKNEASAANSRGMRTSGILSRVFVRPAPRRQGASIAPLATLINKLRAIVARLHGLAG